MLDPVQPDKQLRNICRASRDIAQVPDFVIGTDRCIPIRDDRLVHVPCGGERATVDVDRPMIAEVSIRSEKQGHSDASQHFERPGLKWSWKG